MRPTAKVFTLEPITIEAPAYNYPFVSYIPSTYSIDARVTEPKQKEGRSEIPIRRRSCRDVTFLLFFTLFFSFLVYTILNTIYVEKANPNLLIHGYDHWGNICGQKNKAIKSAINSGLDMTDRPFLSVTFGANFTLKTKCVTQCPPDTLKTVFNRCLPRKAGLKPIFLDSFNVTGSLLEAIMADITVCWREVLYLCTLAFLLAVVLMVMLRYLAAIVIWTTLLGVAVFFAGGTTYIWLLWRVRHVDLEKTPAFSMDRPAKAKQVDQLLAGALVATSFTVIFMFVVLIMRKRVQLVTTLFNEAGKALSSMPYLLLQPIWTTLTLVGIWILWLYGMLYLQSRREPLVDKETHTVSYIIPSFYQYMRWYHLFALLWSSHFVIACQHFIIASSISKWFFASDKSYFGSPLLWSLNILIRYHLGSIALGSMLLAGIKIVRLLSKKIEGVLHQYQQSCHSVGRCCRCFLWLFEKTLLFINKNAYVEIALYGESLSKSAQLCLKALSDNALRAIAINSVGDFLLFLGKSCVVLATIMIGAEILEEKAPVLNYPWSPLIVTALFAYFVSHCFLAVYEMAIDTLFICFLEDQSKNEGLPRPHLAHSGLQRFFNKRKTDE